MSKKARASKPSLNSVDAGLSSSDFLQIDRRRGGRCPKPPRARPCSSPPVLGAWWTCVCSVSTCCPSTRPRLLDGVMRLLPPPARRAAMFVSYPCVACVQRPRHRRKRRSLSRDRQARSPGAHVKVLGRARARRVRLRGHARRRRGHTQARRRRAPAQVEIPRHAARGRLLGQGPPSQPRQTPPQSSQPVLELPR